ncbi:hypothetical protein [Bacteroides sp. GM023]|uniref:hypothetical protein n=1 Tax=Bacteroides sp. GM023 TaxID=2723058 RepID=UPI00168C0971|nr:hypothetical protein [Bacteroides sp. GM023]MBD3589552.1 hypothetical protein [Bacteroides sp. GM023]
MRTKKEKEEKVETKLEVKQTSEENPTFKVEDRPNEDSDAKENFITMEHVTVVIPYVKEKAQGDELRMALRSLHKFLRFGVNVVVIGDREEWMSDEVTVIEHDCVSDNPQIDALEKLKLAIAADEVTDKFIWSNDDIYLVAPVMLSHFEIPKNKGFLRPELYKGIYKENMLRTVELLAVFPKLDFGTHTPVVYQKQKLVDMFERFPELNAGGYLISSVYFNTLFGTEPISSIELNWQSDNIALSIISKQPDSKKFEELVSKKMFLNNAESGYSDFLMKYLLGMFPDKSDFEE